eukprot:2349427-Alexandrium_andersonii.AAC.1
MQARHPGRPHRRSSRHLIAPPSPQRLPKRTAQACPASGPRLEAQGPVVEHWGLLPGSQLGAH